MVLALRAEEGRHDRELTLVSLVTPSFSPRHVTGDAAPLGLGLHVGAPPLDRASPQC